MRSRQLFLSFPIAASMRQRSSGNRWSSPLTSQPTRLSVTSEAVVGRRAAPWLDPALALAGPALVASGARAVVAVLGGRRAPGLPAPRAGAAPGPRRHRCGVPRAHQGPRRRAAGAFGAVVQALRHERRIRADPQNAALRPESAWYIVGTCAS
jgi:hypothetical protein